MKTLVLISLLIGSLIAYLPSYAQTYPCSGPGPGEVVVGQTQGGQGVASIPLCQRVNQQQAQQPPPKWESRWGAIVTDSDKAIVGSASGSLSQDSAERSAISDCKAKGGAHCELQVSYANGCGAMILGDKAFDVDWGSTKAEAIQKATNVCSAASPNCHVYFTTCSPPAQIH
ncbi:DUF4189 domain-containing protein [Glaciimonas soli]|nr:DUF4189 domain-containing protein [Glaciimonas soli]